MVETKQRYYVHATDITTLLIELNRFLQNISDRLDALEGTRGTVSEFQITDENDEKIHSLKVGE